MTSGKKLLIAACAFGLPGALAGLWFWATGGLIGPDSLPDAIIGGGGAGAPPGAAPGKIRVLSYNIHFCVGREDDFDRRRSKAEVQGFIDGIAALIRKLKADIVLLQEVDYDSARTSRINQMKEIAGAAGLPYMTPVVTWRKGYIPFPYWPPRHHYGRMLSGQAVLSRWPIISNTGIALPQPRSNPFYYNAFYLNRHLQHVKIDVAGRIVDVFNVHNEAYDQANRELHSEILLEAVRERGGEWHIAAGDFNSVPPEASLKSDFPDEPETDMSSDRSVSIFRKLGLGEILPPDVYRREEKAGLTFPADLPNRRLDYLYFSKSFKMNEGRVVREAGALSDHLPTFAEFEW